MVQKTRKSASKSVADSLVCCGMVNNRPAKQMRVEIAALLLSEN